MSRKNNLEVFQAKKFLTHAMTKLDEEIVLNLVKQGLEQRVDSFEIMLKHYHRLMIIDERRPHTRFFRCELGRFFSAYGILTTRY